MSLGSWRRAAACVALAAGFLPGSVSQAASVPGGFVDAIYVDLPGDVTAMQFAPDGRLFVCRQSGQLRVVQNGMLLTTPFVTLPVLAEGERGLLGVAFDPDFATNHYVYVYYTTTTPVTHNRLSRITANDNVAVPGSEIVLLELDPLSSARNHNGGAIHFGNDGKLYIAVGDNADGANSQSLDNLLGKILRINRDGTIPADNPFFNTASGVNRAIWALGLRNPFTTAFQRSTGRLFINDVGEGIWEEINEGIAGANYGWPTVRGPSTEEDFTSPFYAYTHSESGGCAITGGAFYESAVLEFPQEFHGQYFFGDFCGGWIRRVDPVTAVVKDFATGIAAPVDLKVGPDGALYYLERENGFVGRISFAAAEAPSITLQPVGVTVAAGQPATFTVGASGTAPLAYQWRRNGANLAGATATSYTLAAAQIADNGAVFDVVVSNQYGSATSDPVQLTVTQNTLPTAGITQPVSGTKYSGGDVINFAGTGNDAEDGALPASAFTWWVDLHHDTHAHPHVFPVSGSKSGSFSIPTIGEISSNVFYRLHLRVTDSGGLTRSVTRDIQPRKSTITLTTSPAGLQLRLDGQPVATPHSFVGVVGIQRSLEAVSPQEMTGTTWAYSSWSDGGARVHTIATPATSTGYTAQYAVQPAVSLTIGNLTLYEGNAGSTTAVFPVTLSGPSALPVSVAWSTTNGSAKAGTDYSEGSGTISFPPGTTQRTIEVTIHGDTAAELKELFYVDLASPSGASIADGRAVGTILNDDGAGKLAFSTSAYRQTENGGGATITVSRTDGLGAGMTVRYATANGTAAAPADYATASGTLSFAAGVVSLSFLVPLANDSLDEVAETVNLALSNPGGGAVLGARATAVLTILDNDSGGILNFSVAAYQRSEDSGTAIIKVLRTGGTASGVSVAYSTAPGTASPGSDYISTSGTLNFAAGQTSTTFAVALIDDSNPEADETINLALASPTGGAKLGTRSTATLMILDDE